MAARRRTREFYERVNPLVRFEREEKFRRRYRLTKNTVRELAAEFGQTLFATRGYQSGGGLTHEERVTKIFIII